MIWCFKRQMEKVFKDPLTTCRKYIIQICQEGGYNFALEKVGRVLKFISVNAHRIAVVLFNIQGTHLKSTLTKQTLQI